MGDAGSMVGTECVSDFRRPAPRMRALMAGEGAGQRPAGRIRAAQSEGFERARTRPTETSVGPDLIGFSRFKWEMKSAVFVGLQRYSAPMRSTTLCQLLIPSAPTTTPLPR